MLHPMPATATNPLLTSMSRSTLHRVLTEERDPHRRQRALVRASLVACPGKPSPRRAVER
jgi:hypothetical protein